MITIDKHRVEELFKVFSKEINVYHNKAINKLKRFKNKNSTILRHKENEFLEVIINEFKTKNLISCSLFEIDKLIEKIGTAPRKRKIKFEKRKTESYLKDEILKCLNYSELRRIFLSKYFQKLGIKACVYCNLQLTTVIEKKKQKGHEMEYKALFQVDHYHPQDKYPYLSIALFNLYPVCASCNLTKTNNYIDFKLYDKEVKTNIFQFKLVKRSKAKFLISRNLEDLEINFSKVGDLDYDDIFNIKEIYSTQKDVAEEIILKSLIYNETYKRILIQMLGNQKISVAFINRFILGNYSDEEEIHKRPLAKFMQDIGKEVELI